MGLKGISAEYGGHEGGTAPLATILASCDNITNSGAHFGAEKTDIQIYSHCSCCLHQEDVAV